MTLLVKPHQTDEEGCILRVTPETADWSYVGFSVYELSPGQNIERSHPDKETCIVLLTGKATVVAGNKIFEHIGSRESVFEGVAPDAVYVPANTAFDIQALTKLTVALCEAPGTDHYETRLIASGSQERQVRGVGANTRYVQDILPDTEDANSLLVVEVVTPSGNWSSYPPHKHDHDNLPTESALEETYYHLLDPAQGFVFQRVYTDDREIDQTMSVDNGDCVTVPKGYHPVGVPYGYTSYYLNVMAGPRRQWVFKNDPDHAWIVDQNT